MKKDKLYTVTKGNKPAVEANIFALGGSDKNSLLWDRLASKYYGANYGDDGSTIEDYMNSRGGWFNMSKANNPFSKGNINNTLGGVATAASPLLSSAIGGGYSTGGVGEGIAGVGSAVGNAVGGPWGAVISAGSSILGGLTNRAFGTKENKGNINTLEQNAAQANMAGNALAGSTTSSDFFSNSGMMTSGTGFGTTDLVKGGWFAKGKARKKGQKYLDKEAKLKANYMYLNEPLNQYRYNLGNVNYKNQSSVNNPCSRNNKKSV